MSWYANVSTDVEEPMSNGLCQVHRETCVTFAYICTQHKRGILHSMYTRLGQKLEQLLLPEKTHSINLKVGLDMKNDASSADAQN